MKRLPRSNPLPRLASLIDRAGSETKKNYVRLALAIRRVGGDKGVDRRKLSALKDGADVSLRLSELAALDNYLWRELNTGLFERPKLLQALAAKGRVTFLLGTYPRPDIKRNDYAYWDVQAMTVLLRGLDRFRAGVHFDVRSVFPGGGGAGPPAEQAELDRLLGPDGPSLVVLGSPRATWASEWLLSRCFGVEQWRPRLDRTLPFCFYWPESGRRLSSFSLPVERCMSQKGLRFDQGRPPGESDWAFRVGETVYVERRDEDPRRRGKGNRKSYAVAAVRQLGQGQMLAVVAGLTGPATYAMSEAITSELITQPVADSGADRTPVWWAALEVDIGIDPDRPGDDRIPRGRRVLGAGTYEPPPQ